MEQQIFEAILGGGGGIALAGLLFYLYRNAQLRAESMTERYIAFLEAEAADDDDLTERPTRPVVPRGRGERLAAKVK